jgi:hypothetical protein
MFLMFKLFTKNPSKSALDQIIKNAQNMIVYSTNDIKCSRIDIDAVKENSNYWLSLTNKINEDYKQLIINNFNEILDDIHTISKHSYSSEVRDIYLNVLQEYNIKIKKVYNL